MFPAIIPIQDNLFLIIQTPAIPLMFRPSVLLELVFIIFSVDFEFNVRMKCLFSHCDISIMLTYVLTNLHFISWLSLLS